MKMIKDQIQVVWGHSPAPIIRKSLEKIISKIVKPTLMALKKEGKHILDFCMLD